jgi:hypothetical protein
VLFLVVLREDSFSRWRPVASKRVLEGGGLRLQWLAAAGGGWASSGREFTIRFFSARGDR